jgi:ABC-type dipeptide/oligopeptide/nickel transport system ATPase component
MSQEHMSQENILSINNLTVEFGSELGTQTALHGISFAMQRGRTTAIVGESGSGKSVTAYSTLRLIEAPGRITAGEILFRPTGLPMFDILALPPDSDALYNLRGNQIAMIFQEPMTALSPVHTIGNQVMEAILTHRPVGQAEAFSQATDMLRRVGINNAKERMHQYPFEFSGGMRQRVVIAMALVCQPELLICDEPTTALDVTIQAEILALIRDLKDEFNSSVLFITHDLGVVAQIADDVVVMHQGRILESGSVRQVLKSPLHPYTRGLLGAMPGLPGLQQRRHDKTRRLTTVGETQGTNDFGPYPLIRLSDGRQVALPQTQIDEALKP